MLLLVNLKTFFFQDNGCSSSESRNCRPLPNQCPASVRGTTDGPPSEETPCKEIIPTMKVVNFISHNLFLFGCSLIHDL